MQIYWTKINKIIEETSEVKTYLLDCPADFTWEEGSHTHFALKGFNAGEKPNKGLVRHMSISTLPHEGAIGITTRIKELRSEFKDILNGLTIGDEVALFKTHTNMPLKQEAKNIYFISSGVGLATLRPLAIKYLNETNNIQKVHSLNIDSTKDYLFTDIFQPNEAKNFSVQFVDNRTDFYEEVKNLATDKDGLFYLVGSNDFLKQNIALLKEHGIATEQMMIDKHERFKADFFEEALSTNA